MNNKLGNNLLKLLEYLKNCHQGYRECAECTSSNKLKNLLIDLANKKQEMMNDLKSEVHYLQEFNNKELLAASPIHQTLVNLKNIIPQGDLDSILFEIQCGETYLQYLYLELLKEELPNNIKNILYTQFEENEIILKNINQAYLNPPN